MKIGSAISEMLHESGEDILVSYRTGNTVLVENGKIKKIYTASTSHEIRFKRLEWANSEQIDEAAEAAEEYLRNVAARK